MNDKKNKWSNENLFSVFSNGSRTHWPSKIPVGRSNHWAMDGPSMAHHVTHIRILFTTLLAMSLGKHIMLFKLINWQTSQFEIYGNV